MYLKSKGFIAGFLIVPALVLTAKAQVGALGSDESPGLDLSASRLEFVTADDMPTLGQGFNSDARRLLSQCLKLAKNEDGIEMADSNAASVKNTDGQIFTPKQGYVEAFKVKEFSQYSNIEETTDNNGFDLKLDFAMADPVATVSNVSGALNSAADRLSNVANPGTNTTAAPTNPTSPPIGSLLGSLSTKAAGTFELVFSHYYITRSEKLGRTELIDKLDEAMSHDGLNDTDASRNRKKAQVLSLLRICGDQFVKHVGYGFGVTRKINISLNHDDSSTGATPTSKMFDNFAPALKAVKASVGFHSNDSSHAAVITVRQDYRGFNAAVALSFANSENDLNGCSGSMFGISKEKGADSNSDIISCTLDPSDLTNTGSESKTYSQRTQHCLETLTRAEKCLDENRVKFMHSLYQRILKKDIPEGDLEKAAEPIFYRTANFEETLFNFMKVDTLSPEILEARSYVKSKMQLYYQYLLLLKEAIYTAKTREPIFGTGGARLRRLVKRFYGAKEVFTLAQGAYQNCNSYRVFDDIGATTNVSFLNPSDQSQRQIDKTKEFLKGIGVNYEANQSSVVMTGQQTCLLTVEKLKKHDEKFKMPWHMKLKRKLNVGDVHPLD